MKIYTTNPYASAKTEDLGNHHFINSITTCNVRPAVSTEAIIMARSAGVFMWISHQCVSMNAGGTCTKYDYESEAI
jgi:hypothetical protein